MLCAALCVTPDGAPGSRVHIDLFGRFSADRPDVVRPSFYVVQLIPVTGCEGPMPVEVVGHALFGERVEFHLPNAASDVGIT